MSVRTEVCITIDTEFSIGGAFADPVRRRPIGEENVTCPADGHENGLGFLLDTFRDHGIAATFFTETLQSAYFGDAPMGRMVERILRAGQDVQLHLHPCWRSFRDPDWRETIRHAPPNDRCDGRGDAEMQDIVADGIAGLRRIGAPAPSPELGAMTARTLDSLTTAWWLPLFPALVIFILAFAANVGGDAIRATLRSV